MSTNREIPPDDRESLDKANKDERKRPPVASPQPITSDSQAPAIQRQLHAEITAAAFSGPLPHPEILAGYDQVVPGAAKRIIAMAEVQSRHRQDLERSIIQGDIRRSWYGLWTGFAIGMTGILGSVVLGLYDHPGVASFLSGSTLVSLVGVFVIGAKSRQEERNQKALLMTGGKSPSKDLSSSDNQESES